MKDKIKNCIASVLLEIATTVLIITFSIGLPIYVRPFYYIQINALDMVENTGYDYDTIKDAYDDVLDYLTLPGNEFGTGQLKYSEQGASHFADCKLLFDLNAWAFIIALAVLVALIVLRRTGVVDFQKPKGFDIGFWSGVGTLSMFALIGLLASIDFDTAFVVFHSIFFPGKDNWLFNPRTDEIIRVMPQQFFMNCAILIVSSIVLISAILIVIGVIRKNKSAKV